MNERKLTVVDLELLLKNITIIPLLLVQTD